MANETEAPTNAGTLEKLQEKLSPVGLTPATLDFVTAVDMWFSLNGKIPTAEEFFEKYGIEITFFEECQKNEPVVKALAERGINIVPVAKEDWQHGVLTAHQLLVANTMVDLLDTRSDKKKLQDLGCSTALYNKWLSNPDFTSYLAQRAEGLLGNGQHEASLALLDKVRQGDLSAIKFYMEYTNRFIEIGRQGSSETEVAQQDFKRLLIALLEIITDEVQDHATAIRISERIRGLVGRESVASELVGSITSADSRSAEDSVPVPQIAAPRAMTPELEKLFNSGKGYND